MEFDIVKCPRCGRTLAHYIKGSGTDSVYRVTCPRCEDKEPIIIFSAGKTAVVKAIETIIEINIKFG